MENPLFSILVANYNNGHFFKDCYESVLNQTYYNWEVIIVDDASTDNSVEIIKQITGDDSRFKLFENKNNKGCGYTKNRCAQLAQGEILGFLDPDDALKENALEVMVSEHIKILKAAIITSKYEFVDLEMNFKEASKYGSFVPSNKSYLTYAKGALTHFATFKKSFYLDSPGIDSKMKRAVDQDLYYKLEETGSHSFVDKVLYSYRVHKNSISCNDNLYKAEYWHFYAINKAYKRRKKQKMEIDNFTSEYIRLYRSNYYLSRFVKLKFSTKYKSKFYFLIKAFLADPFHEFKLKFKSLLLLILGRI
ncbi:glycosyltransferase family 2 protein [Flavobacterium sp. KACC 22761]|uniref:glycosyltransferase family 2 protein n=1 Tax=Flavobacterium sp. KACC 22761 TaxID=3092665 RepID=UPI002A7538A8|nr:glycosyltransferase family 2 protein [Flavobacterium sp. KACC 22761]WPO79500.1 glycosyltransferase family 2 protein [Flavobacterium sp. KACC 22761]